MGTWPEILMESTTNGDLFALRKKYLGSLSKLTGRNVIAYYSGWLNYPDEEKTEINDMDMSAFMAVVNSLDVDKGLDLILHTPGGSIVATEALVKYLRNIFGTNIRAIVPQLAMSAGTMISCSCFEILMGKHSNLGPIDPQFNGIPCQGVIEEFKQAIDAVKSDIASLPIWSVLISKYHPTFVGECQKLIELSNDIVEDWLKTCMYAGEIDAESRAKAVIQVLGDHSTHKTHGRHISAKECMDIGLKIKMLEDDQKLQDAVLSVHHAFMLSLLSVNGLVKIVENQKGLCLQFSKSS